MKEDFTEGVRAICTEVAAEVPDLATAERMPDSGWNAHVIGLWPEGRERERVSLIVAPDSLQVHFGSGLTLELDAHTEVARKAALEEAGALLRAIVRDGYCEEVWLRGDKTLKAQASISYGAHQKSFSTRQFALLWGARRSLIRRDPWVDKRI